jgi:GH25 family lysozyme M1 (1,4-beta-N-acetylmuramidase)
MCSYFQGTANNWTDWVVRLPDGFSVFAVDRSDILRTAKQIKPTLFTIARHWNDNYQWTTDWEIAKQLARNWFNSFIDQTFKEQYAPYVMAVTERNEYDSHTLPPAERAMRIIWMQAASWVWNTEYKNQLQQYRPGLPPIQLVLGENAVGNDLPREAAVLTIDNGDLLGYHAYIAIYAPNAISNLDKTIPYRTNFREGNLPYQVAVNDWDSIISKSDYFDSLVAGSPSPGEFQWASGRAFSMEQAWGLKPTWVFGEFFDVRDATGTGWLQPNDGWRHSNVCGGDVSKALEHLTYWHNNVKSTPAYQEGRIKGFHFFTTPGDSPWQLFKFQQPEMNIIADWIKANWKPGSAPLPPPAPTRVQGTDISRWNSPVNAVKMKSKGAVFCVAKATEHTSWIDPFYSENTAKLIGADILNGAYHFYRPEYDPIEQAGHFYGIAKHTAIQPALDVEIPPGVTFGVSEFWSDEGTGRMGIGQQLDYAEIAYFIEPEATLTFGDDVRQCLMHIELLSGRRPILYTNKYFYDTYLSNADLDEVADLWIAQWTTAQNPTIPNDYTTWHFWQYTSKGVGPDWGVSSTYIDLNYFNGDYQALLDYINDAPPPPPAPNNLLRNWSFESGHYTFVHPNGTTYNNILVPNEWWFRFAGPNVLNEYNSDLENIYQQPEMMPVHRSQIPDDEENDFFWHGDHTLKLFSEHRAWRTKLVQTLDAPLARGSLTVNLFVDCYTAVVNGQKIWATDPNTCLVVPEVNGQEWGPRIQLAAGQQHTVEWEIDTSITDVGLKVFAPFATKNNGVFMDAFELLELEGDPGPFPVYASTVSLMPPTYTAAEEQTVLDHVKLNQETLAYSAHDCVKLATSGLPGTARVWWASRWSADIVSWLRFYGVQNILLYPQ